MNDPSLAERKKRFGWLKFALFAILVNCAYLVWNAQSEKHLQAKIEEIRHRGEPVTPSEMEAYYVLEDGKVDTTPLWVSACEPLDTKEFEEDSTGIPIVSSTPDETSIPWAGEEWPELEKVESFLEKYRDSIDLMHQAAEQGGAARYATDFSQGVAMFPHAIDYMYKGTPLLSLQARVHAHRGESAEVARCLMTMIRLGESAKEEPVFVTQLVRSSTHGRAAGATGDAIYEAKLTDEQMAELQKAFREIEFYEPYKRAYVGERHTGILTALNHFKHAKRDTTTYLALMERMIATMGLPYSEAIIEGEEIATEVRKLRKIRNAFSRQFLPKVTSDITCRTRHKALVRMADAALAVGRFRLAEGKLPESLSECVPNYLPEDPVDPFNGYEIVYEIGEDGRSYRLICTQPSTSELKGRRQRLEVGDWPEEPAME